MKCIHAPTGVELASQVETAYSFWSRLKGLMGRKQLAVGEGLLLEPCPQVHTCFMYFAIDVIFLSKDNRVVAVAEDLKPWRMSSFYPSARRTLELPSGTLKGKIQIGDELIFN
ncbi:MAG: DUF192 domain-containing protein [Elusimicrobiaceae bacterium]|nr:DUF192 domain-containing protein [Elusimicrobiaceae bacterium]